ncbi:MAG: hypothetical protein J5697_01345 [Clostridia bacterium]|nr:hypothetical protein [Clostridia bacterium]
MIKIVAIALLLSFLILCVKGFNNEYAVLTGLAASVILVLLSSEYFSGVLTFLNDLIERSGVERSIVNVVFKVTGIGYLIEFSAGIVEDAGLKGLSDKLVLVGKIVIVFTALPVFYAVFTAFSEIFA